MVHQMTLLASLTIDVDKTVGIQFVVFSITMIGLYVLFGKSYLEVRSRRFEGTSGSETEAAEFEQRAEETLLKYETLIKQARQDATEVRNSLAGQGKVEGDELMNEARAEVEAQLSEQRTALEKSIEEARKGIEQRAEELSNVLVKKVLSV